MTAPRHIPVMLDEVVEALAPKDGGVYVDGTFGLGGYAGALLNAADCRVLGIDRDPTAIANGQAMVTRWSGRLSLIEGRFGDMAALVANLDIDKVDGVALDLGVSSPQIDEASRGFSFREDGPLDMRMGADGPTAAELVNTLSEADLARLIHRFGEERRARAVARAIVAERAKAPIERTGRLAEIVRRVVRPSRDGIDPATRTFQALRVRVNDELGELVRGLSDAEHLLRPGGRLAVVSFHSLEDRTVKEFLRRRTGTGASPSRHLPPLATDRPSSFSLLTRRPKRPSPAEIERNSRARSAKLRAAERNSAAPWPRDTDLEMEAA